MPTGVAGNASRIVRHMPALDVLLNRVKVAEIPFKIQLSCTVSGLDLFLKKGCVYKVSAGKCNCKADILCGEQVILSRSLAKVNLPGELEFSKPIPSAENT